MGRRLAIGLASALVATACAGGGGAGEPSPAAVASSTTSTATPQPTSAGSVTPEVRATPERVLIVGDSVMFDATPAITAALEGAGVGVVQRPVLGFGLTRPAEYYDWRVEWQRLVEEHRPDVVMAMVGGWDFPDLVEGGRRYRTGTAEWAERYGQLLDVAAGILTAQGAHLYWVTSPPYRAVEPPGALGAVNAAVSASGSRNVAVDVVDGFGALATPDGGYTDQLPDDDGVLEWVRKDDGVHLCAAGAARFGQAAVDVLAVDYRLAVDPAWELGPWRADPRYVQGIEGGRCLG